MPASDADVIETNNLLFERAAFMEAVANTHLARALENQHHRGFAARSDSAMAAAGRASARLADHMSEIVARDIDLDEHTHYAITPEVEQAIERTSAALERFVGNEDADIPARRAILEAAEAHAPLGGAAVDDERSMAKFVGAINHRPGVLAYLRDRETGAAGPRPIVGYGGPGPSASDRRTGTASDAAHLVRNLHALRTQIANGVLSETTSQHVGMLTHDQQNARVAALDLQLARQPRDATLERILFNDRAGEGHERGAAIRSAQAAPDGEPPAQRRRTGRNYNQDMSARNDNTRSL